MIDIKNVFVRKSEEEKIDELVNLEDLNIAFKYFEYMLGNQEFCKGEWLWLHAYKNDYHKFLINGANYNSTIHMVPCITDKYRWVSVEELAFQDIYYVDLCDKQSGNIVTISLSCEFGLRNINLFYTFDEFVKEKFNES